METITVNMETYIIQQLLGCGQMDVLFLISELNAYKRYVNFGEVIDKLHDDGEKMEINFVLHGIYMGAFEGAWFDALEEYNDDRIKPYEPSDKYNMQFFLNSYFVIWTNFSDSNITISDLEVIPASQYPKKFVKILREKLGIE